MLPHTQGKNKNASGIQNFIGVAKMALRCNRWYVVGLLILTMVGAALPYLQLGIFGLIVDTVIEIIDSGESGISRDLWDLIVYQLGSLLAPLLVTHSYSSLDQLLRFRFFEQADYDYLQLMANLDLATHEDDKFRDLLQKARERGKYSAYQLWHTTLVNFGNVIGVIVAGIILLSINWMFLIFAIVGAVPALFIERKFGRVMYSIYSSDAQEWRKYAYRMWYFGHKEHIIDLKIFQGTQKVYKDIKRVLGKFTDKQVKASIGRLWWSYFGTLINIGTLGLAIWWMLDMTISGAIAVGTMTFVFGSIRGFQGQLSSFFSMAGILTEHNKYTSDYLKLLETKPKIQIKKNGYRVLDDKPPVIEFKNVWFQYPSSKTWVLKNFNLKIIPGQTLSIVGVNGAGKTTFVKLLCRFYDATKGKILINGVNIQDIDLDSYYSILAVLFQEYPNYEYPVEDAIALGRSNIRKNKKRVFDAAKKSKSHDFIQKLDRKYKQMLGREFDKGIDLSGGQNQRMALARVFYRDAQIVILDEPTASIDAEAEAEIFETINIAMKKKTIITISHRFSTVKQSDKICVIENGKLSEYGSHKELMDQKRAYSKLYTLQAKSYQD